MLFRQTTNGLPAWFVSAAVVEALERLKLEYPTVNSDQMKELLAAKLTLDSE